jgi:beta-carotene/zeaxanthin 4-ketolase
MTPGTQSRIGVALAMLIMASWLSLHVYAIFFFDASSAWQSLLLIVVQTWLSVGLYIVAHDAIHGSLWPTHRSCNNLIGRAAVWLYAGFAFGPLATKHHAHHLKPGSADDPDFAFDTPDRMLPWYGQFMRTYVTRAQVVTMLLRVAVYLLLGAPLQNIVLFFALPGLLSSFQLFYFGTYLPHRHTDPNHARHGHQPGHGFADHHHARSNDFGYLGSLLSCFHFGYHHEHHLYPSAPWWRLPAMRRR